MKLADLMRRRRVDKAPERSPNRAERRAYRRRTPSYRQARRMTRPLRRAFGGWAGAFRPHHRSVKP